MPFTCKVAGHDYHFSSVRLDFLGGPYTDLFKRKNNRTLSETLASPRYAHLSRATRERYRASLDEPLGEFLWGLKSCDDSSYTRFLNPYGDLTYCHFRLADPADHERTGVYAYFEDQMLRYVGRCRDSMRRRIDQGYGRIHPKNCYLDGQATNCHINAAVARTRGAVTLSLCPLDTAHEIETTERLLIEALRPPWNLR